MTWGRGIPMPRAASGDRDQLIASRIDTLIVREEAPLASEEDLARVHTQAHIDFVKETAPSVGRVEIDPDTMMSPGSYHAALRAAGATVAATDAVIAGTYDNAFCSVRPPGHHAEPARAMGFCFFNNIAIAARHALEVHGLERVAIIDFDVHHGNGTEAAFSRRPARADVQFFPAPVLPV